MTNFIVSSRALLLNWPHCFEFCISFNFLLLHPINSNLLDLTQQLYLVCLDNSNSFVLKNGLFFLQIFMRHLCTLSSREKSLQISLSIAILNVLYL